MMKNNIYIVVKIILLFCLIAGYPLVPLYCQNLILDSTTYSTGQHLYFSPGTITSPDSCSKPVQVTGNANITYKAVQYVHLRGGFSTELLPGCGTFHAYTGSQPQASPVAIITGVPVSCGSSVLSSASSINDSGTIISYQWQLNGNKISGATSVTYTATLSGDYTVLLTNSYNWTAISMVYPVSINPVLPVSVTITASYNPVYAGTSVTFTATPINGGTTPIYQWNVNGLNVGTNISTFTYIPLNNDEITCTMTSNVTCATNNPANSNVVTMIVNPPPLTVIPLNQIVSYQAGITSFNVTSNSGWTANSDQTWCTVTPSGFGNGIIIAEYLENTTSATRVAHIIVTVSGLTPVIVTITQVGFENKVLNLTLLLEGLYKGGGTMNQAFDDMGPHWPAGVSDHITVELDRRAHV